MSVRSAQSITKVFTTRAFATGAATDATGTPTGTLYVNGTADAASVTVTNLATGVYKAAVTLPTLALNDVVDLRINAVVAGVTDNAIIWSDTKDFFAGSIPDVAAGGANGLFIAGTNAATTVTTAFTTTFTGNLTGSVASVTGLTVSDVGAIKTKTDFLPSATAGAAGGVFIAGNNAATTLASLTVSGATNLAAVTISGAVAFQSTWTVTGNILFAGTFTADMTGSITTVTGNVAGSVGSVTAAITLPTIPLNWITANGLATDAGTEIGTAVWATAARTLTAGTNILLPSNGLSNITSWTVTITGDLLGRVLPQA